MLGHPTIAFIALLLAAGHGATATLNSFYFSFPSKTDTVPLVHSGDVLNVTWFSEYSQANLLHWCGTTNMQTVPGLSGDGHMAFTINKTWTGSCHWQLVQQGDDAGRYVDSGFVEVANATREGTSAAWTYGPEPVGTACGLATVTATRSVQVTATAAAAAAAAAATASGGGGVVCGGDDDGCGDAGRPTLSTGASMGIGVAIGAAVAGIVTVIAWVLLRRRATAAPAVQGEKGAEETHGDTVYRGARPAGSRVESGHCVCVG